MIVHQDPIPPIWHPIARFLHWRKRRAREEFREQFRATLVNGGVADIAEVQKTIAEQMSDEAVVKWNAVHRRTRWYSRLWRWATGCCR